MAISATLISQSIMSQFSAPNVGFKGTKDFNIADAVSKGVYAYLLTPNLVTCSLNGLMGPIGTINSIAVVGLEPNTLSTTMYTKARSDKQLTGRDIGKFFNAISIGICTQLMSMILSGTAVGIATGIGTGSFTSVVETALTSSIFGFMKINQLNGTKNLALVECISYGIATHLKSVTFTVMVAGVVAPVSPVGPVSVIGIPSLYTQIS